MIKVSDYVIQYIEKLGVKDVFLLSGGGCMHLVDSLGKNQKVNYKCCLFEQVVSLAAGAYAQYNNEIGVGLVTTGPGGTNAITGVAVAWTDSIPLFMISGQVKTPDLSHGTVRTKGFQELDIVSMVKPITKYAVTIEDPQDIKRVLEEAAYWCKEGRPGPVWVDIPLDIQAAMIEETTLGSMEQQKVPQVELPIKETVKAIQRAKRPVILAGYGITTSKAKDQFRKVIEKYQIPVLTTWKAMDLLPEDHPLFMGRPGCIGQRGANFIQQNSDLIITIGARLDFGQIGYAAETFARGAFKIVNDVDRGELEKFSFKVDQKICADSGYFLQQLLEDDTVIPGDAFQPWRQKCALWKQKYPVIEPEYYDYTNGVSSYVLMDKLNQYTNSETCFSPGNSGACSEIFSQAYRVKEGQRVINTNSLGSMGTGLPASIGTCIASGGKTTICINGDGGIQMNLQDFETIRREKLPIKFFILNNQGYGSIMNSQRTYFKGNFVGANKESGVTLPALKKIADLYDIRYYEAVQNSDLDSIIPDCLRMEGPTICEIHVSPDEKTAPRQISYQKEDGSMVSKPLEDLAPLLSREELQREMMIELVIE